MNAFISGSDNSYGANTLRSARDIEYDMFSRVTRMLRKASESDCRPKEIDAVHKNNELWTILAVDLSDPKNALPDDVKIGLLSLARFSVRHGRCVMSGHASTEPLVEINMSIMKGLRSTVIE